MTEEIEGFILAGGASSRMNGRNKALLRLGGKTMIERAAAALQAVSRNIYLVGKELPKISFQIVPDIYQISKEDGGGGEKRRASIIGVHAALFHSKSVWTAILACDLPFASGKLLSRLAELGEICSESRSDFEAVVPVQPDGGLQPLCAFYKTQIFLPKIEKMIVNKGEFRLREIFTQSNIRRILFSEIADLPNAENFFFNINTPEEMLAAVEIENKLNFR